MSDSVIVSSGLESGLFIGIGTSLIVESGGTVLDTTVLAGGEILVAVGGVADDTQLTPGGTGIVTSGGLASGTKVESAAIFQVSAGGSDAATLVQSGGTMITSGAADQGITAESGAVLSRTVIVSSGEVFSGGTVVSGERLDVLSGGVVLDADVQSGGYVAVESGALVSDSLIESGGYVGVSGGSAIGTEVSASGQLAVTSGLASATTVASGGFLFLSNSLAINTTSAAGAILITISGLGAGESLSGTSISAGTSLIVSSGASTSAIQVLSGGTMMVSAGGIETGTTVAAGGLDYVSGVSQDAVIAGYIDLASPDGVLDNAHFISGGSGRVNNFDTVNNVTIGGSALLTDYGGLSGTATFEDQGRLVLYDNTITAPLVDFDHVGNSVDLTGYAYARGAFAVAEGDVLVLQERGVTTTFALAGDYTGVTFSVASDSLTGGTLISVASAPCFAQGTRIDTPAGPRPVEALRPGDLVTRQDGSAAPVIWIGHRRLDCRRHPAPDQVRPVRIAPDAFGPGLPRRPLLLSPDHAVWWEGVLIPVKHLVNGRSVRPLPSTTVTYFHVELAHHDIILAEGLAVESYLDTGDRSAFQDGAEPMQLHPIFGQDAALTRDALSCAPLCVTGPEVNRLRRLLGHGAAQSSRPIHALS